MTPQFDVTITRLGPGSDRPSLMLTFEAPLALEGLDEDELEIRDDGYTHGVGRADDAYRAPGRAMESVALSPRLAVRGVRPPRLDRRDLISS
ncbi:hypothetical protein ACIRPX_42490 [Streptomyces sp. NPDC101225]|uniref:hypothetical protein n=1 Tax=Streptomyces sp. NPDC101225 TaxID=3366135 RepID=UPI00380F8D3E